MSKYNNNETNGILMQQLLNNTRARKYHSPRTTAKRKKAADANAKRKAHENWLRKTVRITSPKGTVRHSHHKTLRSPNHVRHMSPHRLSPHYRPN
jgi:hypothetical protein